MQETYIAVDHVLRVVVKNTTKQNQFYFKNHVPATSKFFGLFKSKEIPGGWVNTNDYPIKVKTIEEILKDSTLIFLDNSFYKKSSVCIESIGGKYTNKDYKYFDSFDDAKRFVENITRAYPTIKIEY